MNINELPVQRKFASAGPGHVYRLIATCQQSCEQRDCVILIEKDKESASFSAVLVHSM